MVFTKPKKILKKFCIVSLTVIILFMQTLIFPAEKQKVHAWAIALPAGVTAGAGLYVLGALAVGAVAMAINESYGEEIQAHAKKVWNNATELAKDSLYAAYDAAYSLGQNAIQLGGEFLDWAATQTNRLISGAIGVSHTLKQINSLDQVTDTYTSPTENYTYTTVYPNVTVIRTIPSNPESTSSRKVSISFNDPLIDAFIIETSLNFTTENIQRNGFSTVTLTAPPSTNPDNNKYINMEFSTPVIIPGYTNLTNTRNTYQVKVADSMPMSEFVGLVTSIKTIEDVLAFVQKYTISGVTGVYVANVPTIADDYIVAKQNLTEGLQRVAANPIPVPVADVYPYNPATSERLTWDDVATTYRDTAGVPYTGDIAWNVPIPGVYDIEGDMVIGIPIGDVIIDVITGQPIPGTGNPPINPPNTDWLTRMKGLVTTKFPFSLPWDFYGLVSVIAADPIKPHIIVNETYMGYPFHFEIKFDSVDPYVPFFRAFILIGVAISLVFGTRKLLGGAT